MNAAQKKELVGQAKAHFAADMLLKQKYGVDKDGFKGCSVGCHLHHIFPDLSAEFIENLNDKHRLVAEHYGYPEWLAHLQDAVFEGLPNGESAAWHVQLAETLAKLPDDYDWKLALHRVHVAILRVAYRTAGDAQAIVQRVIDLHERAISGNAPSGDEWCAAEHVARSAAESASWSAWSASWSASWSAWSAWYAAEYAARSAARYAARSDAFQEIRDGVLAALSAEAQS